MLRSIFRHHSETTKAACFAYRLSSAQRLSTIHDAEVEKFSQLSSQWWVYGNELQPLRSMNSLRIPYIVEFLKKTEPAVSNELHLPLKNVRILEVGSGGGFLSEAMARLGAAVTGIEPSYDAMSAASTHAKISPSLNERLCYKNITLEEHSDVEEHYYDAVVASEVIEHVNDPVTFVDLCCDLVMPGGHIFLTTLNRSLASLVLAKYAAEYVLGVAPKGAHDWDKFIPPAELTDMLRRNDMTDIDFRGMLYNPLARNWAWCRSSAMNYACHAVKPADADDEQETFTI